VQTAPNDKLQRFIGKIRDLPTLPRTVLRITELINDPRSSARDLARVITEDQVLTARLLRLVNSAFYGFPQKVTTVTGAVVLLGFDAIRNLLLSTSVFDLFAGKNQTTRQFFETLWDHSLACAVSAKTIGDHLRQDKSEELFVAGLLHDIGKIVELIYLGSEFSIIVDSVQTQGKTFAQAEFDMLGCTHTDTGQLLARFWNLPVKLTHAIGFHHKPVAAGQWAREAAIVHLADIIAHAVNPTGEGCCLPRMGEAVQATLDLTVADIEPVMRAAADQFAALRQSIQPVDGNAR